MPGEAEREKMMSKASKWAKESGQRVWAFPGEELDKAEHHAHVLPGMNAGPRAIHPMLVIFRKGDARLALNADAALSLARWILDTFGEGL